MSYMILTRRADGTVALSCPCNHRSTHAAYKDALAAQEAHAATHRLSTCCISSYPPGLCECDGRTPPLGRPLSTNVQAFDQLDDQWEEMDATWRVLDQ